MSRKQQPVDPKSAGGDGALKQSKLSKFGHGWQRLGSSLQHNKILLRTVMLVLPLAVLFLTFSSGAYNHYEYNRNQMLTVSNIGQQLTFSKSGAAMTLGQQYRNGDTLVVPIQFTNPDSVSLSAKEYNVLLKGVNGHSINVKSGKVVLYGSTGLGAIILKGSFEAYPMQVILNNQRSISTNTNDGNTDASSGTGRILIDGRAKRVDGDAVSFTVNPKANNVKSFKNLDFNSSNVLFYRLVRGNQQLADLNNQLDSLDKSDAKTNVSITEYKQRLAVLNKALGKASDDMSVPNDNDDNGTNDSSDASSSSDTGATDSSNDVANTTAQRVSTITTLTSLQGTLDQNKQQRDALQKNVKDTKSLINSMDSISQVSSNFSILNK